MRNRRHWLVIDGWHRVNALLRLMESEEKTDFEFDAPNVRILKPNLSERTMLLMTGHCNEVNNFN